MKPHRRWARTWLLLAIGAGGVGAPRSGRAELQPQQAEAVRARLGRIGAAFRDLDNLRYRQELFLFLGAVGGQPASLHHDLLELSLAHAANHGADGLEPLLLSLADHLHGTERAEAAAKLLAAYRDLPSTPLELAPVAMLAPVALRGSWVRLDLRPDVLRLALTHLSARVQTHPDALRFPVLLQTPGLLEAICQLPSPKDIPGASERLEALDAPRRALCAEGGFEREFPAGEVAAALGVGSCLDRQFGPALVPDGDVEPNAADGLAALVPASSRVATAVELGGRPAPVELFEKDPVFDRFTHAMFVAGALDVGVDRARLAEIRARPPEYLTHFVADGLIEVRGMHTEAFIPMLTPIGNRGGEISKVDSNRGYAIKYRAEWARFDDACAEAAHEVELARRRWAQVRDDPAFSPEQRRAAASDLADSRKQNARKESWRAHTEAHVRQLEAELREGVRTRDELVAEIRARYRQDTGRDSPAPPTWRPVPPLPEDWDPAEAGADWSHVMSRLEPVLGSDGTATHWEATQTSDLLGLASCGFDLHSTQRACPHSALCEPGRPCACPAEELRPLDDETLRRLFAGAMDRCARMSCRTGAVPRGQLCRCHDETSSEQAPMLGVAATLPMTLSPELAASAFLLTQAPAPGGPLSSWIHQAAAPGR